MTGALFTFPSKSIASRFFTFALVSSPKRFVPILSNEGLHAVHCCLSKRAHPAAYRPLPPPFCGQGMGCRALLFSLYCPEQVQKTPRLQPEVYPLTPHLSAEQFQQCSHPVCFSLFLRRRSSVRSL